MSPPEEEIRQLLLKYITGETTLKEAEQVEDWLDEDPEIYKELEELWDLWCAVGTATDVFHFNVDEGWNETLKKIRRVSRKQRKKHSAKKIIWISATVAATFLFLVGLSFWQGKREGKTPWEPWSHQEISLKKQNEKTAEYAKEGTQIQTHEEQRRKVTLPDGSQVWLNGNTSIRFFMNEGSTARILYLRGQAFFDVTHKANKPFIVKTKHASIKVLGTRFSVSAYSDDSTVEATLTAGRILFKTTAHHRPVKERLQPGQQIAVNYISNQWKVSNVDTVFYTSWKEGKIIFNNQPFQKVAQEMEHKYNIHVIFQSDELKHKKLNGYLEKESLDEALKALKLTLQFQYRIQRDTIIISK